MDKADNRTSTSPLLIFAVLCEVAAAVVCLAPSGSLAFPAGAPERVIPALVLIGIVVGATALWRLITPGPKPPVYLFGPGGPSLRRTLYYGFLAAIALAFYRALWVTALNYAGTTFEITLGRGPGLPSAAGAVAGVVTACAAAYLFFGYVQGLVGITLGRRAGLLASAALAAVAAVWPLGGGGGRIGEYGPWLVFAAWRLPEALAFAYLGYRTRSVVAPLTAAFVLAWLAALGRGLFGFFGNWPFLFAVLILLLIAVEIALAERRRIGRAAAGFFRALFAGGDGVGLLDALLWTAALAAVFTVARGADLPALPKYIGWPAAGVVLAAAALMWWRRRARGRQPSPSA